jgi:uncharacterized LabA/DUF88 family protein/cold shock CspA family protein
MSSHQLIKIGVFYDGNYFLHVSNYYNYQHERKARINIGGLHNFIRDKVAKEEGSDVKYCQVVDAHYFRGRMLAHEAQNNSKLFHERVFDDILMLEGVVTHYLPLRTKAGRKEEKGIDVWLALEAFELAIYKKFDVVVLVAADGDYVPLIRKLNTLGVRVMVLSWDFEYTNSSGQEMVTRTSQELLEEVTYPVAMHEIIDNRLRKNDPIVSNLFVNSPTISQPAPRIQRPNTNKTSTIKTLVENKGYGFITYAPENLFFHFTDVDGEFNDLRVNDTVEFLIEKTEKYEKDGMRRTVYVAKNIKKLENGVYAANGGLYTDNDDE